MDSYAHMCRDGHVQIGYNDSTNDELCPMCLLLVEIESLNDIVELQHDLLRTLSPSS